MSPDPDQAPEGPTMTEHDPEALTRMVDQMRAGHYPDLTVIRTSRLREITTQGTGR